MAEAEPTLFLLEALMVSVKRAHLARPAVGDHQVAVCNSVEHVARRVDQLGTR